MILEMENSGEPSPEVTEVQIDEPVVISDLSNQANEQRVEQVAQFVSLPSESQQVLVQADMDEQETIQLPSNTAVPVGVVTVVVNPTNGSQYVVQMKQDETLETQSDEMAHFYTLRCSYCGQGFADTESLKQHEITHIGYECSHCGKLFTQESNLIVHEQRHTGDEPYKCRYCNKVFAIASNLYSHEARHTGLGQFQCTECDNSYVFLFELKKHMLKYHPDSIYVKPFKCFYCSKRFARIASRTAHAAIHTDECPHKCKLCSKSFKHLSELQNHRASHPAHKHGCPDCDKTFSTATILKFHRKAHHGLDANMLFSCTVCSKTFKSRASLWTHKKIHFPGVPLVCNKENCGKKFKNKYSLKAHMAVHLGDKPFKCDQCLKTFMRKISLDAHKITHDGRKNGWPYTCAVCNKGCSYKSELIVHERTHTGERPFECKTCGQKFSQRGNLSQHEFTHINNKAHKCQYHGCSRAYKYLTDLQKHQKIKHAEEMGPKDENNSKRFECKHCGKKFKKSSGYRNHECKAGTKPFACNKCSKKFAKLYQLQNHKRQHLSRYKCEECSIDFVTELLLQQHKSTHAKINCSHCDKSFAVEKDFKQHLKSCIKHNELFKCSACSQVFTGVQNLKMHEAKEHGLSPFRCKICVEGFQRASQLQQHMEIHMKGANLSENESEGEDEYSECDSDEEGSDKSGWEISCSLCEQTFDKVADLEHHMAEHVEKESFACGQCMKEFLDVPSLRMHEEKEHDDLDPYPCDFCELRFTNRSEQKQHSDLHMTLKCQHCSEFFPTTQALKDHEGSHFLCEYCSVKLTSQAGYDSHIIACRKRPKVDKASKADQADGTGAKDGFPCPLCNKLFSQLGNMQTHKRKVHGLEPYQCQLCGEYFSLLSLLKRHLAKGHPEPIEEDLTATETPPKDATAQERRQSNSKNIQNNTKNVESGRKEITSKSKVITKQVASGSKTRSTPNKSEQNKPTNLKRKINESTPSPKSKTDQTEAIRPKRKTIDAESSPRSKRKSDESKTTPRPQRKISESEALPRPKRKAGESEASQSGTRKSEASSSRPKRGVKTPVKKDAGSFVNIGGKLQDGKLRLPFKCRHCEMRFPSASKKMQHELQSH